MRRKEVQGVTIPAEDISESGIADAPHAHTAKPEARQGQAS
jgi:hypothetical protein